MRTLPDPHVLAFLLVDTVLLLVLYGRLLAALRGARACLRSTYSTMELLGNTYLCSSVNLMSLLLLPVFAATLSATHLSKPGYFWTVQALIVLVIWRKLVYLLMGWLTSRKTVFHNAETISRAIGIAMVAGALPAFLAGWVEPDLPSWVLWGWIVLAVVVCGGVYVFRVSALFLHAGFSIFFRVLYLCGLEILPVCVVANYLIHGN